MCVHAFNTCGHTTAQVAGDGRASDDEGASEDEVVPAEAALGAHGQLAQLRAQRARGATRVAQVGYIDGAMC